MLHHFYKFTELSLHLWQQTWTTVGHSKCIWVSALLLSIFMTIFYKQFLTFWGCLYIAFSSNKRPQPTYCKIYPPYSLIYCYCVSSHLQTGFKGSVHLWSFFKSWMAQKWNLLKKKCLENMSETVLKSMQNQTKQQLSHFHCTVLLNSKA